MDRTERLIKVIFRILCFGVSQFVVEFGCEVPEKLKRN